MQTTKQEKTDKNLYAPFLFMSHLKDKRKMTSGLS